MCCNYWLEDYPGPECYFFSNSFMFLFNICIISFCLDMVPLNMFEYSNIGCFSLFNVLQLYKCSLFKNVPQRQMSSPPKLYFNEFILDRYEYISTCSSQVTISFGNKYLWGIYNILGD